MGPNRVGVAMTFPVATNLITGFLGSGKTTLMKHVLTHGLATERVAVIMNEMADLGIDGKVLQGLNVDRMVELSNGCICCSGVLQLGLAVQEIMDTVKPTVLLVESSGVAEPFSVVAELRGIGVRTDSVITVVDAENVHWYCKESDVAEEQIRQADFIVLNKLDLVEPSRVRPIEKRLSRLNARAMVLKTRHGAVDTDLLFTSSVRRFRMQASSEREADHTHTVADGFESFVFKEAGSFQRASFEHVLREMPQEIYRAKGIIRFEGESQPSLFNHVCGRSTFDWIALPMGDDFVNQAVFIGRGIGRHQSRILRFLRRCRTAVRD